MSYLESYLAGQLPAYRAPHDFIPGGNAIGMVIAVGADVWHLTPGQRVVMSSHLVSHENMEEPGQILIGVTSPGDVGDALQQSWKDGTLAEYALFPAQSLTPIEGLDHVDPAQLAVITRCVVPFGGLLRGRLRAGEHRQLHAYPKCLPAFVGPGPLRTPRPDSHRPIAFPLSELRHAMKRAADARSLEVVVMTSAGATQE